MNTVIRTRIIKIGNSHGIRIPKLLLERSGLGEEVELTVEPSQLVIRPARRPRQHWDEAFAQMAAHDDDQLLDGEETANLSNWDKDEWEW